MTPEDLREIIAHRDIEDTDGDFMLATERQGGHVHHLKVLRYRLVERQFSIELSSGVLLGVVAVDARDVGRFEQKMGLDLRGAYGRGRIGGDEGVARPAGEDHNIFLRQRSSGAHRVEGLGISDWNRRLQQSGDPQMLQALAQGHPVEHGGEHAHLVGDHAIESFQMCPADEISAAGDDGQFDKSVARARDNVRKPIELGEIKGRAWAAERCAGEF